MFLFLSINYIHLLPVPLRVVYKTMASVASLLMVGKFSVCARSHNTDQTHTTNSIGFFTHTWYNIGYISPWYRVQTHTHTVNLTDIFSPHPLSLLTTLIKPSLATIIIMDTQKFRSGCLGGLCPTLSPWNKMKRSNAVEWQGWVWVIGCGSVWSVMVMLCETWCHVTIN